MDGIEVVSIPSRVGVRFSLIWKVSRWAQVLQNSKGTAYILYKMYVHCLHKLNTAWWALLQDMLLRVYLVSSTVPATSLFLKLPFKQDVFQSINSLRSLYAKLLLSQAQRLLDSMRTSPMKSPVASSLLSSVPLSLGMATWARSLVICEISWATHTKMKVLMIIFREGFPGIRTRMPFVSAASQMWYWQMKSYRSKRQTNAWISLYICPTILWLYKSLLSSPT